MYLVYKNKNGKWAVKEEGKKRACKVCDSKVEAIAYATKRAAEEKTIFKVEGDSTGTKKHKALWIILLIILLVIIAVLGYMYATGKLNLSFLNPSEPPTEEPEDQKPENNVGVKYDGFQMHFLELGNKYTGDSTYIKAGDVDILIDGRFILYRWILFR